MIGRISTYSADLFGMCSALYELGGLCVMHDASGCNSTYCTHDEPRWFDMDSMIYISALTEDDAVMGCDERLIDDIADAVKTSRAAGHPPKFVAIGGSPMPLMIGCDIPAIAKVVGARCKIPAFGAECGGINDYTVGAGVALKWLADTFCKEAVPPTKRDALRCSLAYRHTVNIIGATPLDFSINGNVEAMIAYYNRNGSYVISTWAMGSTLEDIEKAGLADENIVVSATGFGAAKRLEELYGTPYTIGIPVRHDLFADDMVQLKSGNVLIIGEAVCAHSIRQHLEDDFGANDVRVLCPLMETCGILRGGDLMTDDEEQIARAIARANTVIADPLYRRAVPSGCDVHFIDLPHEAYSGRMYHDKAVIFAG